MSSLGAPYHGWWHWMRTCQAWWDFCSQWSWVVSDQEGAAAAGGLRWWIQQQAFGESVVDLWARQGCLVAMGEGWEVPLGTAGKHMLSWITDEHHRRQASPSLEDMLPWAWQMEHLFQAWRQERLDIPVIWVEHNWKMRCLDDGHPFWWMWDNRAQHFGHNPPQARLTLRQPTPEYLARRERNWLTSMVQSSCLPELPKRKM